MISHVQRPRSSSGIEKAGDRKGWWTTSVTHITSQIHNVLSRSSPVFTHFSLTTRSSLSHTHRFLGFHNSTPDILSFSGRLMTLLRVSVSRVTYVHTPSPCPHSLLSHTHRFLGSHNSTPDTLSAFSARLTTLLRVSQLNHRHSALYSARLTTLLRVSVSRVA